MVELLAPAVESMHARALHYTRFARAIVKLSPRASCSLIAIPPAAAIPSLLLPPLNSIAISDSTISSGLLNFMNPGL